MVKEKASSYLLDQYKVMEGMEEQHKLLKRKLPAILDVIEDAEEQAAAKREGAKAWLDEVRIVAYKANDVLDEFKYEVLRRKAKEEGHYKALGMDVIKLFPTHNRFVFRYRMANKLRMILQQIDVLIAEMNAFRFRFKPGPPEPTNYLRRNSSDIIDPANIASRSRAYEKEEVVRALRDQVSNENLTVHPIVGMGGLGKTTLAQLIYNDPEIQKHFELRLWVCVSNNFDVDSLADRIVKENGCKANGTSAPDRLQDVVKGKRYLLILDDVWNRDEPSKWEKLKSYLQHGGSGSSVLITTHDDKVAQLMGTTKAHDLKNLEEIYIKEIIEARAFGSKQVEKRHRELVDMVGDIVKRCSGSPLAATALGLVLHTKTSKQEWEAVLNRSMICDDENGILPVLKLSYNCLPSYMRQCFAFSAITIGQKNFNELKSRSFFQDLKSVPFDEKHLRLKESKRMFCYRITCKIHDLMHDVAQSAMGKECAAIATQPRESEDALCSARHLYVSVRRPETLLNASLEKGPPASTLICDKHIEEHMKILSKHNSIRALKINRGSFLRQKYLHHLRYLDLSESDIEALPEDISILYHLQTLNLSYCEELQRLPKKLKYLPALHHLYTHGCKKLKSIPAELGHLTCLQTITYFVAGTDSSCSNVGELQNLDLSGRLGLSQLENARNNHEEVVEGLKPHDGLKALRIYSYSSSTFPRWMDTLNGMVELALCDCERIEKLPVLSQLPALQILLLKGLKNLNCLFSGGTTPLRNFKAWYGTDELQGEEPVFPKIEELEIKNCGSLPALPKAASVIVKLPGGLDFKCCSAFPELRKMSLSHSGTFDRCVLGTLEGTPGDEVIFPLLEDLSIDGCPKFTDLPEAPKLSKLAIEGIDHKVLPLVAMMLTRCDVLFSSHSSALALWTCFAQLVDLTICECDALVHWPENVLQVLVSLRKLSIQSCNKLTGQTEAFHEQSAPAPERGELLPCLEYLWIVGCASLVEVPHLPQSLKTLRIEWCSKNIESIVFGQQGDTTLTRSCETTSSTAVLKLSSTANHPFLPCLESLTIRNFRGLSQIANLPPSIKTFVISHCRSLESLGSCLGELRSLEELSLYNCKSLISLPDRPQAYSSLRVLKIQYCKKIKLLPRSLQSRLDYLDEKDLDAHYEGNVQFPCFF
ncbi:hypothetical protein PVAP13_6NG149000 [Panicum virgatum]|uniref:Uncharacterized protein n=1 Tax=Panicum virgatum TaxID=38727 RepID=A0A8T0R1Z9_PANVG|nr:hypothetical protein PVAP13_6NG149000 [Panicum virgatum]